KEVTALDFVVFKLLRKMLDQGAQIVKNIFRIDFSEHQFKYCLRLDQEDLRNFEEVICPDFLQDILYVNSTGGFQIGERKQVRHRLMVKARDAILHFDKSLQVEHSIQ